MRGRAHAGIGVLCVVAALGCDEGRGRQSAGTPPPGGSVSGSAASPPQMPAPSPPKAAAMAWGDAVDVGNFAGAQALSVGTPEQLKALEAICAENAANKAFDAAVDTKLPDELSGIELQGLATTIQYADEFVEGDTVMFHVNVADTPITLRKQPDGEWRVTLEKYTSDMESTARTVALAYQKLTQEVNAGKYANRTRAIDALGQKLKEAAAELGVELTVRPVADMAGSTESAPAAPAAPATPAAPAAPAAPPAPAPEGDGF